MFQAKIEASPYNINGIYTEINVARNKVQTFKAELPLQMAASSTLVLWLETVYKERKCSSCQTTE